MGEATYWNGLPTPARKVIGIIDAWDPDRDPPQAWWRDFEGDQIHAVEVVLDGVNFGGGITYLEDTDGSGWRKVTEGRGSPSWPHRNIPLIEVEPRPPFTIDPSTIWVEPLPPEVQEVFESFWADIVCPGGRWNLDQVKCELHDAWLMIDNVPRVYGEVTDNRLSKPTYSAADVISVFRERFVHVDDALTFEELECLESLLDILDDAWASTGPVEEGSEGDVLRSALRRINGDPGVLDPT